MAGPARLTPTGLQPGSAESFSTFINGVPAAKTPFTGQERVPLVQNGFTVYAPPGSSGFGPPVRTILTANTSFYVATTGSDSNSGSITSQWATLQHAFNTIATYDFAGFSATVQLADGTYGAFVMNGYPIGVGFSFTLQGNVSDSTKVIINNSGPNYGGLGPIDIETAPVYSFAVAHLTLQSSPPDSAAISLNGTPNGVILQDVNFVAVQVLGSNPFDCIGLFNGLTTVGVFKCSVTGAWNGAFGDLSGPFTLLSFLNEAPSTGGMTLTGTPSFGTAFLTLTVPNSEVDTFNYTFTGSATGKRFVADFDAAISTQGSGVNFFPGNSAGTLSPSASYDGFIGSISGSGTPTTTQFPDSGTGGLYKDTSGGGVYMVYNDAGTIRLTSDINLNTNRILGGSSGQLVYDNSGTVGEAAGTTWDGTNDVLTIAGASVATSHPVLTLTQTWNDGGGGTVVFTGLKENITDTSSAAGSLLLDLQKGGTSQFHIDKFGNIYTLNSANSKHLFGGVDLGGAFNFFAAGQFTVQSSSPGNGGTVCLIQSGATTGTVAGIQCQGSVTQQFQFICYNQHAGGSAVFQKQITGPGGQAFDTYNDLNSGQAWSAGLLQSSKEYRVSNGSDLTSPILGISALNSVMTQMSGALATNSTDGFLYIPTCAGAPTGTPTTHSGMVPIVYDTTDNKLYIYNSGWKGGTNPGVFS